MAIQKLVLERKKFVVVLNGTPTDITQYVLVDPPVELEWGFAGDNPVTDLLAPTGTARFTLNNISGIFTPDSPGALAGWMKGIRCYIELTYEGAAFRRFAGFIGDMIVKPTRFGSNVAVTVVDWLDVSSRYPMDSVPIGTNQRADQVAQDIINRTFIQPEVYNLNIGVNLFPLTYSSLTRRTRAYTEFGKVAASEFCHIYLRKDQAHGETLVLENMLSRHGWNPLVTIRSDPFFILKAGSATDYVLKAGSTTDRLISAGGNQPVVLDNTILEGQLDIRHGANVLNIVEFTAYPSRTDTSNVVLFALQEPIRIGAGQTIVIRGNYFNATTGVQCNGMSMVTPVANVDYKAWTNSDASGTDFTMSLTVTPVFNSDGFEHTVYNASTNTGYITLFNVRGLGVYLENTISSRIDNDASIAIHGDTPANLDQKYQRNLYLGEVIAKSIVEQRKDATMDLKAVKFNANTSKILMRLMMVVDVGDLLQIKSSLANINGQYYVQRVKIIISAGDLYTVECLVTEQLSIMAGSLTEIGVEFRGEASRDAINFGHIPYLADLNDRTMTAWVKLLTGTNNYLDYVMGFFSDGSAFEMLISNTSSPALGFYQKYTPNGQQYWFTSVGAGGFVQNQWTHVAVYKNLSSDSPPKLYINGVQLTANLTSSAESGKTAFSDAGVPFILGNIKTATIDYQWGFQGAMQDARLYNRELTLLELTKMYNAGVPDPSILVDSTMLFQALAVRTSKLSSYVDQPLTGLNVFENVFRAVGAAVDAPTGRTAV